MLALHAKTDLAAKQVEGQDIVLLLGHTGAGKSTSIHFLGGSTMKRDPITGHIEPAEVKNKSFARIRTEFKVSQSVTRYISAVPMKLSDAGVKQRRGRNRKDLILLCDSPGFDDAAGPEVDVANGLGIVKGVSKAKSVKIILVIGIGDFEMKMKGIKALTHTLAKILPKFDENFESIVPIFTKMSRKTPEEVKGNFNAALSEMERRGDDDEALMQMLEHLAQMEDPILLHPIESDRTEVLNKVFSKRDSWIKYPGEAFEPFVTQASRNRIKQQILKHQANIAKAVKTSNYDVVVTKLSELVQLNAVLPDPNTRESIKECVKLISVSWNEKCNRGMKTLATGAKSNSLEEFVNAMAQYGKLLDEAKECDMFQHTLESIAIEDETDDAQHSNLLTDMIEQRLLFQTLDNVVRQLLAECTLDTKAKIYFNKAKAICKQFGQKRYTNEYDKRMSELYNQVQSMEQSVKKLIDNNDNFEAIYSKIALFGTLEELEDAFESSNKAIKFAAIGRNLQQHLIDGLRSSVTAMQVMFSVDDETERGESNAEHGGKQFEVKSDEAIKRTQILLKSFEHCHTVFGVPCVGIPNEFGESIHQIYGELLQCIVDYFRQSLKAFKNSLSNKQKDSAMDTDFNRDNTDAKAFVHQMCLIRKMNNDLKTQTSDMYYQTKQSIIGYLHNIRRICNEIVDKLDNSKDDVDCSKLVLCVNVLRNYGWVFALRDGEHEDARNENGDVNESNEMVDLIEDKLIKHVDRLFDQADNLFIDLNAPESVMEAKALLVALKGLKQLHKILPNIGESLNRVGLRLQSDIRSILWEIQKDFTKPNEPRKEDETGQDNQDKDADTRTNVPKNKACFHRLNGEHGKNVIDFLDKCRTVAWCAPMAVKQPKSEDESKEKPEGKEERPMRQEIQNTRKRVQTYLLDYGEYRMKEAKACFDYLVDIASKDAAIHAMKMGITLSNALKEFTTIEEKYKVVMSYLAFENPLQEWNNRFEEEYTDLHAKLQQWASSKNPRLQIGVTHARALGKIDWFLKDYAGSELRFKALFSEFSRMADPNPKMAEFRQIIENGDFMEVESEMERIEASVDVAKQTNSGNLDGVTNAFKKCKQVLGKRLVERAESVSLEVIKMTGMRNCGHLDVACLSKLQKEMNSVTDARRYCQAYLSKKDLDDISDQQRQSSELIVKFVSQIARHGEAAIGSNSFASAEVDIEQIQKVSDILGNALSKNDDNKESNSGQALRDTKDRVEDKLNIKLGEIENTFVNKIHLNGAVHNPYTGARSPKQLHRQMEPVMQESEKYKRRWEVIELDLYHKFRNEMNRGAQAGFAQCNQIGRVLEQVLRSMPHKMYKQLEIELRHFKTESQDRKGLALTSALLEENDFAGLCDVYKKYQNTGNTDNAHQVTEKVKRKVRTLHKQVTHAMAKHNGQQTDVDSACDALAMASRIVHDFRGPSNKVFKDLDQVRLDMVALIVTEYDGKVRCISQLLAQEQYCPLIVDSLNSTLAFVTAVVKRNESCNSQLLSESVSQGVKKLKFDVKNCFDSLESRFIRSLDAYDMASLKNVLDCMRLSVKGECQLMDCMHQMMGNNCGIGMDYAQMIVEIETRLNGMKDSLTSYDFSDTSNVRFANEKRKCYEKLKSLLTVLKKSVSIETHLKVDATKLYYEPALRQVKANIKRVCDTTESLMSGDELEMNTETLRAVNDNYSNLKVIAECDITGANGGVTEIKQACQNIENKVVSHVKKKKNEAMAVVGDAPKLGPHLVQMAFMKNMLIEFESKIEPSINQCLKKYKTMKPTGIGALMQVLETDDTVSGGWGSVLASQHAIFKGESMSKFNKATQEQGIDEVLKQVECNDGSLEAKRMKARYANYDQQYRDLIEKHLRPNLDLSPLVDNVERIARNCREKMVATEGWPLIGWGKQGMWNTPFKDNAIELMANIFAIWTLQNSKHYFDAGDSADDQASYLMQARVAQVVSIMRILSIDAKEQHIVNNLVEIGTGEGKSLTLAVTSSILALLGFDVSCACYSQYLSDRDFDSFKDLFDVLRITKYIHYGTFNKICENIINEKGNVRRLAENMIVNEKEKNKALVTANGKNERKRILLIDEVDVFFNKEFYGNTYTPAAVIRHPSIRKITDLIWQDHKQNGTNQTWKLNLGMIKKEAAYAELEKHFASWTTLLDEAIKDMLVDVREFGKTEYVIKDGKIGYKDGDQISTTATLGYQTLFTYYKEQSNVNPKSFDEANAIYIKCGSFSYAEIPDKQNFVSILGVTGTLRTLSQAEQDIMKVNYNIARHTYMPSLFGDRSEKFEFNKLRDIKLYEDSTYFENLKVEITERLNERGSGKKRCVFVCFESKLKMNAFLKSASFSPYKNSALILNEEANKKEKDSIVRQATMSGKILLLTKVFGRGTDFQVKDPIVKSNGGPHMIQTFLSEQKSEEVQIMGRTARQGGKGSYSMVLKQSELEAFDISNDEIKADSEKKESEMYELMNEKRLARFKSEYDKNSQTVRMAEESHKIARELALALQTNDQDTAKRILLKQNCGASVGGSKIAVLMDATGSMGGLLTQAKGTVKVMFDRVSQILVDNGYDGKCFQIQFIAYRSYGAVQDDMLLQMSGWSSDGEQLKQFLDGVDADWGQGAEAVEVALQHVNRMVTQNGDAMKNALLIGDAPPTETVEDVKNYRDSVQSTYDWASSQHFADAVFFKTETAKLKANGVKLNTYYLDDWAKRDFAWMAQETGGVSQYLDVNSASSAETLTHIVSQIVLGACDNGSGQLVQAYEKQFMHT